MNETCPWLVTKGRYDPEKRSVACAAVLVTPGGQPSLSAMCTINAREPADGRACDDTAAMLGRMLLARNGIRRARAAPGSGWAGCADRSSGLDADIVPARPDDAERKAIDSVLSAAGIVLDDGQDEERLQETMAMAAEAVRLSGATPCGHGIRDADTVLKDVMDEADFEENGLGTEIIRIWMDSRSKGPVEKLFLALTGVPFRDYLARCLEDTAR